MRALRFLCALVVVAGGCVTTRAAYLHAKAELAGVLIRRAWEQEVQSGKSRAPVWDMTRLSWRARPHAHWLLVRRACSAESELESPETCCWRDIARVGSGRWSKLYKET